MADPIRLPAGQLAALQVAYSTPPRAYHSFAHVQDVLRHYGEVDAGPGWRQPAEPWVAVLYHDAIYMPGRRDNEKRSADLALEHIQQWLPDAGLNGARVAELIELTARHGSVSAGDLGTGPGALDAMHFLDCDMAILGASADTFGAYDRGIAAEYAGVLPAVVFRFNRRRFLKSLLERDRIFLSEYFHERYDASARENIERALGSG